MDLLLKGLLHFFVRALNPDTNLSSLDGQDLLVLALLDDLLSLHLHHVFLTLCLNAELEFLHGLENRGFGERLLVFSIDGHLDDFGSDLLLHGFHVTFTFSLVDLYLPSLEDLLNDFILVL